MSGPKLDTITGLADVVESTVRAGGTPGLLVTPSGVARFFGVSRYRATLAIERLIGRGVLYEDRRVAVGGE